jgi:ankyrin repeat domain-containing protein 50
LPQSADSSRFLHASLQLQALRECTNRRDVETTLLNFPPKIKDVYIQTWNRITNQPSGKASLALNVLTWVTYATRSLTIDELRHGIASCPETYSFDKKRLVAVEMMVAVCCGLLMIEKETNVVRLIRELSFSISHLVR